MLIGQRIGYTPYTWYPEDYVGMEGGAARREIEEADKIVKFVHDEGDFERLQQKTQGHALWYRNLELVKTLGGYYKV
jgi:hypothetical protein